jgi:hypothetical protein
MWRTRRQRLQNDAHLSGSFLVADVEDAHPQHEHYHPQYEDGTVEVSISRMPGSSPTILVIHRDSEHHLQQPW